MAGPTPPRTANDSPETFWNSRALRSGGDPIRAVCLDDARENECIDRVQRALLRAAVRRLEQQQSLREKSVLDYGCGTGRWVTFLERHGCRYSGVDLAQEMLEIAKARHPDVDLKRVADGGVPHADHTFDLVWSIAVVHHNPYDTQERILGEMVRVLKGNGTLLLLEGLGVMRPVKSVYYPRPLQEWLALAGRYGMACDWYRGASYFILRSVAARLARHRPEGSEVPVDPEAGPAGRRAALWHRVLTRMDAIVDPYILWALPRRYHTRAVMIFHRKSEPSVTPDLAH